MSTPPSGQLVLTLNCADRIGIVHAVAGFLLAHDCNIVDSQQFDEGTGDRFYLRIQATYPQATMMVALRAAFQATADTFGMTWSLVDAG